MPLCTNQLAVYIFNECVQTHMIYVVIDSELCDLVQWRSPEAQYRQNQLAGGGL